MPTLTKNKKILIAMLTVFLVLGFVFVAGAHNAQALIGEWVMGGLAWIAYAILTFFSKLVTLAAFLLKAVFDIEDKVGFTNVGVVTTGWTITRGLANMVIALILLIMSFDTILQINKFPIKTVLPRLIAVALLINFSLMFCGLIIDAAQILTRYFIDAAGGPTHDISAQLANGLSMANVFKTPTGLTEASDLQANFGGTAPSLLSILTSLVFGIIIILVAAFALAAGAIFMLIRMVKLWLLLITAPIAWVAMIAPGVPGLGGASTKWWSQFFETTFFGPIYAFYIYLAVLTATAGGGIKGKMAVTASGTTSGVLDLIYPTNSFLADGIGSMLQYIVIIVILVYGIKSAQRAGLEGANAVIKRGTSMKNFGKDALSRWAARGAPLAPKFVAPALQKMGFERAARGWDKGMRVFGAPKRVLAPLASPDVWRKANIARKTRAEQRAFSEPSGAMQDILSIKGLKSLLTGKMPPDFYQTMERDKVVGARISEINRGMPDENQRVNAYLSATDPLEKEALIRSLGSTNSINTLFQEMFTKEMNARPELKNKAQALDGQEKQIGSLEQRKEELEQKYREGKVGRPGYLMAGNEIRVAQESLEQQGITRKNIQAEKEQTGITAIEEKYKLDPEKFQNLMAKEFGNQANRIGNDVQMAMTSNGNLSVTGTYQWDSAKNRIKATTEDERKGVAQGKFNEWEPQKFWTSAHPDSFFQSAPTINHKGEIEIKVTGLTGNGKVYLENMTGLHYGQVNRAQGRMLSKIVSKETQQAMARTLDAKLKPKYDELVKEAAKVLAPQIQKPPEKEKS